MDFQSQFTIEEKNKRLIELRNYWQKGCGQFKLFQPDEAIASGIGIVSFKDPSKVVMALREKGIHVTQIDRGDIHGIRVSANICHDEKDLDHFIAAMNTIQS